MASLHYGCCKVGSIAFLVICGSVDFFVVHVSGKLAGTTDLAFPIDTKVCRAEVLQLSTHNKVNTF
jgi:hypothetical protein